MDSTRIKIGQFLYGQKEGSEEVAIVKVESVGVGGINYNDTDNSFQYSFDELFGIPISADVLLSSGFTLSGGLYVNDSISFIKIKQINRQWFWYADRDKCILVKYLHELQALYGELTGNTLAVDEEALLIELESQMVLSAPEGFAASGITPNSATITWDDDADAEGYAYQIDDGEWVEVLISEIELTGLTYSTPYTLRFKSLGDDESFVDSPESEEFTFTTAALIVLASPADLTATEVGENEVTVTWSAVANAAEYEVAVGETTDTVTEGPLTYQFTSLDVYTGYTFSVKAVGDGVTYGDSELSEITVTTLKEQLDAPEGFAASGITPNSATITWDDDADAEGYAYQIDDGEWVEVLISEIELTGLTYSTPYTLRFKSLGDDESFVDSPESEEFTFTTAALIVLASPADLTATEVGENEVTVTWSAVANAAEYEVAVGETTDTVTEGPLTYQFTSLDVYTGYTFSVKAVGDGVTYGDSELSEITVTTLKEQLDAPTVAGSTISTTSVKFSWGDIANAASYSYSIDDSEIWESTEFLEITLDELAPGTSYTMHVKAIADAEGDYRDSDAGSGMVSTNSE